MQNEIFQTYAFQN